MDRVLAEYSFGTFIPTKWDMFHGYLGCEEFVIGAGSDETFEERRESAEFWYKSWKNSGAVGYCWWDDVVFSKEGTPVALLSGVSGDDENFSISIFIAAVQCSGLYAFRKNDSNLFLITDKNTLPSFVEASEFSLADSFDGVVRTPQEYAKKTTAIKTQAA